MDQDKKEDYCCIYKPPNDDGQKALDATIGVKFSNDIFLMQSFLDQQNIEYKLHDLEESPYGFGLRIKRD